MGLMPRVLATVRFNSRTPCGVRLTWFEVIPKPTNVSIHAPRAGCDILITWHNLLTEVSIHAPRAGCD